MGQGFDVSRDNFIGHYIVFEVYLLNPVIVNKFEHNPSRLWVSHGRYCLLRCE